MKEDKGVIVLKKLLPIIIVLVLIGAGAYFYFNRSGGQTGGLPGTSEMFQGSLETAVSRGAPFKCEWESEGTKVTTYVKGEKIYSEAQSDGKMQYSIMKDNCTWSWGDEVDQAVKFCFEETDYSDFDPTQTVDYEAPEGVEYEEQETEAPEYNCVPTTISDSKFDPPTDVNFMTF